MNKLLEKATLKSGVFMLAQVSIGAVGFGLLLLFLRPHLLATHSTSPIGISWFVFLFFSLLLRRNEKDAIPEQGNRYILPLKEIRGRGNGRVYEIKLVLLSTYFVMGWYRGSIAVKIIVLWSIAHNKKHRFQQELPINCCYALVSCFRSYRMFGWLYNQCLAASSL